MQLFIILLFSIVLKFPFRHNYLLNALINQVLPEGYVNIINDLYSGNKVRIITDKIGEYFEIRKGIKRREPLSPLIFNRVLEQVFRKIERKKKGLNIKEEYLNNLRFTYDVVLITENIQD